MRNYINKRGVISLKEFANATEYNEYSVLLCSNNREYHEEIRQQLYEVVDKKRVIDVFELVDKNVKDVLGEGLFSPLRFKEPRVAALECAAREIIEKEIEGNVAEAGVFQGNFARYINEFFPNKTLYLIDTFEGFDQKDVEAEKRKKFSDGNQDWSDTSVQLVLDKMKYPERCMVKKGWFPGIMEGVEDSFCFVSLDMDLYQPIYEGLCFFYPKLVHGGYIFVHDCRNQGYQGSRQAVIDFCNKYNLGYVMLQDLWGTAVICK